jgi:hypothetical protein
MTDDKTTERSMPLAAGAASVASEAIVALSSNMAMKLKNNYQEDVSFFSRCRIIREDTID